MKNFWKKYHKWVGLFFSFFILMFCFSGIVLNHRTLFSKAEVSRNWKAITTKIGIMES